MSLPRFRNHCRLAGLTPPILEASSVLWLLSACLILLASPALSQSQGQTQDQGTGDETTIELNPNGRAAVRLAFPAGEIDDALSGDYLAAAQEIEQTLRDDLAQTKLFDTQGPAELAVLVLTGQRNADFDQYRSLGNEVILLTSISRDGDRMVLQGWAYDLASKQSILGKRYRGTLEQARKIAHKLMDSLYYQFMGRHSLALTNFVFQSDRTGHQELFLMDYDGHNQVQISRHKSTSGYADWSPKNDAIAYLSYFSGSAGIYYVDVAAGVKVPIYTEGTLNLSPSFSPDGSRVAFASSIDANIDIFLCERACVAPQRITTSRAIDTNPAWSPDGSQIAFSSSRSGRPHIYVMKTDGSDVRRISFEGNYNEGANWSPDGRHLVYASRSSANRFRVVSTDLISLETKILAQGPKSYEEPTYSPDGKKIAFTVRQGREAQIFIMDADGGNWRQLTYEGNNSSPDWSRPLID